MVLNPSSKAKFFKAFSKTKVFAELFTKSDSPKAHAKRVNKKQKRFFSKRLKTIFFLWGTPPAFCL